MQSLSSQTPPLESEESDAYHQPLQRHSTFQLDIPLGLALVEYNEQTRCREWFKLILQNPAHQLAFTSSDEYSTQVQLEKEIVKANELEEVGAATDNSKPTIDPACRKMAEDPQSSQLEDILNIYPVIEQGIDRMWLAQLAGRISSPIERSKDTLMSFKCEPVFSVSNAMSILQCRSR